jgi:ribosomal protein L37E
MSDISCPKCGHTALSIATRCPQCGHPFESRLWQSPVSAEGRRRVPARLVIAGVVIVLVVVGVAQRQSRGPVSYLPARRAAGSTASAPAAPPAAVLPADSSPPADPASPPDPTPTVAQRDTEPATATAPPPATVEPSSDDSSLERRYASTWVNVREGRSGSTPVVQVLKPGEAVSVDSLRQGWYRVLNGGTPLGYVDRSLVGQEPESVSP